MEKAVGDRDQKRKSTMRILETPMGESLATTIQRALILVSEHNRVCVIHNDTPVIVHRDSSEYGVMREWEGTRRVQAARCRCEQVGAPINVRIVEGPECEGK